MRKDYGYKALVLGFVAFLATLLGIVANLNLDEATRYFYITLILILGVFAYFEFVKEYKIETKP